MDNETVENFKDAVSNFGRKAKNQVCDKAVRVGNWAVRNKEMLIVSAPILIAGIKSGQSIMVNKRLKKERKRIDSTYYDPSTGFHWELKRKATNADRAEITKRKKEGKDTYDILRELNLIR